MFVLLQRTPEGRVTNSRHSVGKPFPLRTHEGARGRRPRLHRQGVHGAALVQAAPESAAQSAGRRGGGAMSGRRAREVHPGKSNNMGRLGCGRRGRREYRLQAPPFA